MSEILELYRNLFNILLSTAVIIAVHFSGIGSILYWIGGLLVLPMASMYIQYKYALGHWIIKLSVAVAPWLIACGIGLFMVYNHNEYVHDGAQTVDASYYNFPLLSTFITCGVVVSFKLFEFVVHLWVNRNGV